MDTAALAVLIPVLALATGFVHALKRPRDSYRRRDREAIEPSNPALAAEVALLRHELADTRERLDFMERLLAKPQNTARSTTA
ncbi:MAG TPA: hypothetical protein VE913_15710 [Longimicrobium sp.]|nr:hypothetical protein [Longimicrobium sp.]